MPDKILVDLRSLGDARWQARDYLLKEAGLKGKVRGSTIEFQIEAPALPSAKADLKRLLKRYLRSKKLASQFKVTSDANVIRITHFEQASREKTGRERTRHRHPRGLLRCPHCGKVSQYPDELRVHQYAHYAWL